MYRTRTIGGVILIATGLVWLGQGLGILQGESFMVGDPAWIGFGVAAIVIGILVIAMDLRRRPGRPG